MEYEKKERSQLELANLSKITGTVIIFDLTDSTKLKEDKKEGMEWIKDYTDFFDIVAEPFNKQGITWKKFLGDAFLFFIPEKANINHPTPIKIKEHISLEEIVKICTGIMESYWEEYKVYKKTDKGEEKNKDYREITCAIDYGSEVINWYQLMDDIDDFDPIGRTVDKAFRISGIAGPGQFLLSKEFMDKLDKSKEEREKYIKISIEEDTLKGFPKEQAVFYHIPSEDKKDYILSENNVFLIEKRRSMETKGLIKLLRRELALKEKNRIKNITY